MTQESEILNYDADKIGELSSMDRLPIIEQVICIAGLMEDCKERTELLSVAAIRLRMVLNVVSMKVEESPA